VGKNTWNIETPIQNTAIIEAGIRSKQCINNYPDTEEGRTKNVSASLFL
jgi:hypothetical protein